MRLSLFAPLEGMIAPAPSPERIAFLTAQPFAHRGLHDHVNVENSRGAFRAAIAAGHGIELDVQPARTGEPYVFHDYELDRLTRERGLLSARPASELDRIKLAGTDETLPRLTEILTVIAGRVPVLIEIKKRDMAATAALCLAVRRTLEGYAGAAAVMSFNPAVIRWFAEKSPRTVRGLVVSESDETSWATRTKGAAARWIAMMRAKPDFLAYDVRSLPSPFAARARARGLPVLTWTVRDAEDEERARSNADESIYEKPR